MAFAAGVLPVANVAVFCAIHFGGGAHGNASTVVAAIAVAELIAIAAFCALRTERPLVRSTLIALVADLLVSIAAIYVFIFVFLVVGYSAKGGGD